jgi:pimeloyl-ACP methyl ester carboxylesterase
MSPFLLRVAAVILFIAPLASASGCAAMLTEVVLSTPHRLNPWVGSLEDWSTPQHLSGIRERFLIPVRKPLPAEIAVSIIDPPDRLAEPLGTIVIIHGIRAQGLWMHGNASQFARAGYRAVLVDLRGHGSSTGETLSFGIHEAQDLVTVVDELAARGLLAGRLGVDGHSYGATTAIHFAAIDPRVAAVVAISPFADMRDEVPHYVRTILPGIGHLLSDDDYDALIDEVGRRGQFDPDDAQAEVAILRVAAPVLLLHGADDIVVPPGHSKRIHAASPANTELEIVPGVGHFGIWLDAATAGHAAAWLDRRLKSAP